MSLEVTPYSINVSWTFITPVSTVHLITITLTPPNSQVPVINANVNPLDGWKIIPGLYNETDFTVAVYSTNVSHS